MEYLNIDLLDNTLNETTKFRTKNRVEINNYSRGRYNTNSRIKFKTSMLKSNLYDYSDVDTSILTSRKNDKYQYLTGKGILPSDQKRLIEQVKFFILL